jgi:hypothetical protein
MVRIFIFFNCLQGILILQFLRSIPEQMPALVFNAGMAAAFC